MRPEEEQIHISNTAKLSITMTIRSSRLSCCDDKGSESPNSNYAVRIPHAQLLGPDERIDPNIAYHQQAILDRWQRTGGTFFPSRTGTDRIVYHQGWASVPDRLADYLSLSEAMMEHELCIDKGLCDFADKLCISSPRHQKDSSECKPVS